MQATEKTFLLIAIVIILAPILIRILVGLIRTAIFVYYERFASDEKRRHYHAMLALKRYRRNQRRYYRR